MGSSTINLYYRLTKPGIIYGNLYTGAAGFLFGSRGGIDIRGLVAVLVGTALVIASACVVNNITDIKIDKKMDRTKKRSLVSGQISVTHATLFASILGVSGFAILISWVNWLTVLVGVIGYVDYTIAYALAKRHTPHSTLIGSISGATPILAGYTGATGMLHAEAIILFLTMVIWQMPHFYAIGLFQRKDYKKAGIPLLTEKTSHKRMVQIMCLYIVLYGLSAITLGLIGAKLHFLYMIGMSVISLWWLKVGLDGWRARDTEAWARQVFKRSLVVLLIFSISVALAYRLP